VPPFFIWLSLSCGFYGMHIKGVHLKVPEDQGLWIKNEWKPGADKMKKGADGLWSKAVMLPPGRYEYKFVVDGGWVNDPANDQLLPNIFGTSNNVLDVR
jgi:hypothetical protein